MQQYSITILNSTALPFTAILYNIPKVDRKIDWWIVCDKNENREFDWKGEGEKERKNYNLIIPVMNVVIRFERKNQNEEVYFTLSVCVSSHHTDTHSQYLILLSPKSYYRWQLFFQTIIFILFLSPSSLLFMVFIILIFVCQIASLRYIWFLNLSLSISFLHRVFNSFDFRATFFSCRNFYFTLFFFS